MKSRLERSNTNRVISGVCGGIAEYLAVDPTLVRVAFVVMTFVGGVGILAYIVLLILMPQPGQPAPFTKAAPSTASTDTTARVEADSTATPQTTSVTPVDPAVQQAEAERRRSAVGYLLIALGVVFLLSNVGAFRIIQWNYVWPLVLIGLGALFLLQRVRS
ncbi:MAG: PspC domain-containing protein [Chloroflexota bacterium]|nr:PspC domain-containing protein [Chloroflexota bacterium]